MLRPGPELSRKFSSSALLFLLASGLCSFRGSVAGPQQTTEVIREVVWELVNYHAVDCVQIFRNDDLSFREKEALFQTWKMLATAGTKVTTGIYTFEKYAIRKRRKTWRVSCYRSIKILGVDEKSRRSYSDFTKEFAIKDAIWLIFSEDLPLDYFRRARVLFDDVIIIALLGAKDLVSFYEIYKIGQGFPLKVLPLGNWTKKNGLSLPQKSFYDRRSDLEGISLKTASVESWPATYLRNGKWKGFLVKVWEEVKAMINCSSVAVRTTNEIGMKLDNGSWNGIVGMAVRNEVDLVLSEIVINKERSHVLKFFHPIMKTRFQIYTRHLGYRLEWSTILKPFSVDVWIAVFAWLLIGTIFFAALHRFCVRFGLELGGTENSFLGYESFFFVLQALCQQGRHSTPKSFACRFMFFLCFAVSGVLVPSYSASLVSSLAQKMHYTSFNSLQEMVEDGSYRLLLRENSAQQTFLAHAKDAFLKKAYERLAKNVPAELKKLNMRKSMAVICRWPKYALMGVEEIVEVRMARMEPPDCTIVPLKNPMNTVHLTIATSKESAFWGVINHHLKKLIVSGVVSRLKILEFPPSEKKRRKKQIEVELRQLTSVFVFLLVFVTASVLLLMLEIRQRVGAAARNKFKRKKREAFLERGRTRAAFELKSLKKLHLLPY